METEIKIEPTTSLPDDFYQESNLIKAKCSIPTGKKFGPFSIKKCSTDHGDNSIMESTKQEDSFQFTNDYDKWIKHLFWKKNDFDKPNMDMLVDDSNSLLMLEALEDINENKVIKASTKPFTTTLSKSSNQVHVPAKICPHCGIRFSSTNTLKAHVASYCSRRPVNIEKAGGWQTRKRVAPVSSSNMNSPITNNTIPSATNAVENSATSPELNTSNPSILQNELNNLFQHPAAVVPNGVTGLSTGLLSPSFCLPCNLFFASRELFELHLKMSREHILMEPGAASSLVLAAPVFTNTGIHYIPIHPRTSSIVESLRSRVHEGNPNNVSQLNQFSPTTPNTSSLNNLPPSYLLAVNGMLNASKPDSSLALPGEKADGKVGIQSGIDSDDTKPLDLRMIAEAAANASNLQHFKIMLPNELSTAVLAKQPALNNNISENSDARRLEEQVLQSQAQNLLSKPMHDNQIGSIMQRPYLCSYCNTRFQSLSTFQAHQHFYCQKRHCFTKRRRLTGGGIAAGGHSSDENEDNNPTLQRSMKTSRQSSHPSNSDSPHTNKEILEINDNQRIFIEKVWEESKDGYRCCVCGYVGQTLRGMKMHVKMHECIYQTEDNSCETDDNITVDVCSHPADDDNQQSNCFLESKSEMPKEYSERCFCPPASPTKGISPTNYKTTNREETISSLHQTEDGNQTTKPLSSSKQCASCGTHFYQLPEFIKHMKVGCSQTRVPSIKQEETSPV